jgi:hypothetical protein
MSSPELNDEHPIYSKLENYGLPVEDQDLLDSVAETLEWLTQNGDCKDLLFVRTAAEKRGAFHFWGKKRQKSHQGQGLGRDSGTSSLAFICIAGIGALLYARQEFLDMEL